jgi:hypothetical protein
VLFQPVEARLPLSLLLGDPADQLLHSVGIQPARPALTVDPLVDQAAPPENTDVARYRLVRQVERLGEFTHGRIATSQPCQDRSASPITQGGESGIQGRVDFRRLGHIGERICNSLIVQQAR